MPSKINKFSNEQLSALSIFLEIEVSILYKMTLTEIRRVVKRAAKSKKMKIRDCIMSKGSYRMLHGEEDDVDELVSLLEGKKN